MNIKEFRQREKAFTVTPEDVVGNTANDVLGHNNVSFETTGSYVRVSHEEYTEEAGFDLTDFGNVNDFINCLRDMGISPHLNYFRVQRGIEYEKVAYLYCWANEELLIVTGNNPITGEYSSPTDRPDQKGYASYIGIEGRDMTVAKALDLIKEYAEYYGDIDPRGRSFI
jgi:hypothetical protein